MLITEPTRRGIPITERGSQLHATADGQIAELIDLISTIDEATLRRPCPSREKLGDGTVGASVRHTVDNYERIAAFVETSYRMSGAHRPARPAGHRGLRFLRGIGHGPAHDAEHNPSAGQHEDQYTAETINLNALAKQLSASRENLRQIAQLTDSQLDAIPPKDSFRFCDGQRTLEQVLASLIKHQSHQVGALNTPSPERCAQSNVPADVAERPAATSS